MAKTNRPRKATPKPAPATVPEPVLTAAERDADAQFALARADLPETTAVVAVEGEITAEQAAEVKATLEGKIAKGEPLPKRVKDPRLCPVVDCDRLGHDHLLGLCGAHYASRRGDHA